MVVKDNEDVYSEVKKDKMVGTSYSGYTTDEGLLFEPNVEISATDSAIERAEVIFEVFCVHRVINYIHEFEYELKKPIQVKVTYEDELFYVESSELDIYVDGASEEEAFINFYDFFITDFENWVNSNDAELTDDAMEMKKKYLEYVSI